MVQSGVLTAGQHSEVVRPVIELVAVDVVDNLVTSDWLSANSSHHHMGTSHPSPRVGVRMCGGVDEHVRPLNSPAMSPLPPVAAHVAHDRAGEAAVPTFRAARHKQERSTVLTDARARSFGCATRGAQARASQVVSPIAPARGQRSRNVAAPAERASSLFLFSTTRACVHRVPSSALRADGLSQGAARPAALRAGVQFHTPTVAQERR